MNVTQWFKAPSCWLLCALFLAAFTLRASQLDLMEFKHDEAVAWVRAQGLVRGIEFPRRGLASSKGIENFPLFLYLVALFQLVLHKPQQLVWPIALLNSLAVFPVFFALRRLFNARVAGIATLLYAVSPCAISFSRKIWAQDLLPFWASALFFLGVMLLRQELSGKMKTWLSFLFGALATTSWQVHYSGLFLAGAWLLVFLALRPGWQRKAALAGVALGLLPALPWFFQHTAAQGSSMEAFSQAIASSMRLRLKDLALYFIRQPADENFPALLGPDYLPFMHAIPGYNRLRFSLSFCVLGGLLVCCWQVLRGNRPQKQASGLVLLLGLIPILVLGAARIPLSPSYFIICYPVPFLWAAIPMSVAWDWLERRIGKRPAQLIGGVSLLLICSFQCAYLFSFLAKVGREGGTRGEYGTTYQQKKDALARLARKKPAESYRSTLDLSFLALKIACQDELQPGVQSASPLKAPRRSVQEIMLQDTESSPLKPHQRAESEKVIALAQRLLGLQVEAQTNTAP